MSPESPEPEKPDKPTGPKLDADQLAHLEDQRTFLLASLADLEREHDVGDLDDDDYAALRDDYTARAAETLRAMDEQRAAFADARRPRSTRRTVAIIGGVGLFAVLAGFFVAASLGARKAGETSSGGITVAETTSQQANACIQKMAAPGQDPTKAIACFKKVLAKDDQNVVALSWLGWQLSLSAPSFPEAQRLTLQQAAQGFLDQAVKADPDYSYARAFRAVIAYRNGDPAKAKQYLADFKAHDPSAEASQVIQQMGLEKNIEQDLANPLRATTTTTTPTTTTTTAVAPG
ncbi:MAG: hypothetical protein JWM89_2257 [Acidimicrobiales bacterium]|nr:hypothetical protein [Acidimicrobiales bacterium]